MAATRSRSRHCLPHSRTRVLWIAETIQIDHGRRLDGGVAGNHERHHHVVDDCRSEGGVGADDRGPKISYPGRYGNRFALDGETGRFVDAQRGWGPEPPAV